MKLIPRLLLAFLPALASTAQAGDFTTMKYALSEPRELKKSSLECRLDTASAVVEVRVAPHGMPSAWTLSLDNGLSLHYAPEKDDALFGHGGRARVSLRRDGRLLGSAEFTEPFSFDKGDASTLGLAADGCRVRAYGGAASLATLLELELDTPAALPAAATVDVRGAATLLYMAYREPDNPARPVYSLPVDADADGPCGYWTYLDRENDPRRACPGGHYTLAVTADDAEPGSYLILYVDGAETDASKWLPGMLKGRLRQTSFVGQYDLVWYPAKGPAVLDRDCHATYDAERRLLTLDFPLLHATLRFVAIVGFVGA